MARYIADGAFNPHLRSPEFAERLGLPPARTMATMMMREAIIANGVLWGLRGRQVQYSRRHSWYRPRRRYLDEHCTHSSVTRSVDDLAGLDVIASQRVRPGPRNHRQSTFEASCGLLAAFKSNPSAFVFQQRESIWLRDAEKKLIPYTDTPETIQFRRAMNAINEGLGAIRIDVPDARKFGPLLIVDGNKGEIVMAPRPNNAMVRIFNRGDFSCGGRMFGWHQGIPKAAREHMTIDGEPIAEADFSAMHLTLLYGQAGLTLHGDAYDLGGRFDRDTEAKRAVNTMLNAATRTEAIWALKCELGISRKRAVRLVEAVERRHKPIAAHFNSDIGVKLMRVESDIMVDVTYRLLSQGIPILPVHDAALESANARNRVGR